MIFRYDSNENCQLFSHIDFQYTLSPFSIDPFPLMCISTFNIGHRQNSSDAKEALVSLVH